MDWFDQAIQIYDKGTSAYEANREAKTADRVADAAESNLLQAQILASIQAESNAQAKTVDVSSPLPIVKNPLTPDFGGFNTTTLLYASIGLLILGVTLKLAKR